MNEKTSNNSVSFRILEQTREIRKEIPPPTDVNRHFLINRS